MTVKIIKIGTSRAVVIPKEAAEKYNLDVGTSMDFKINTDGSLTYTPTSDSYTMSTKDKKVAKITMNFINRYRKDLEALKDK